MLIEYHRIYNGRDGRETVGCGGGGGSLDLTLAGTVRTGRCTAQGCDKNTYFCSESAAGPVGDRRRAATQSANRHLQRPGHPHRTAAAWLAHRQIHEKMPLDAAAPAVRIDLTEDIRREGRSGQHGLGEKAPHPPPTIGPAAIPDLVRRRHADSPLGGTVPGSTHTMDSYPCAVMLRSL